MPKSNDFPSIIRDLRSASIPISFEQLLRQLTPPGEIKRSDPLSTNPSIDDLVNLFIIDRAEEFPTER